jgi:PIN domain nuclease of toxin-antitoxin system
MKTYVLDACAMLAVLSDEQGADVVEAVYNVSKLPLDKVIRRLTRFDVPRDNR